MYRTILEGGSLRSIATAWNAAGVMTTMGNRWHHFTVRWLLKNPRYVGKRTYKGTIAADPQWPAIVDQDTFDAVHAILSLPERNTTTGQTRLYLLPGLALCGRDDCGRKVITGRRTGRGVRTYLCPERHRSRAAEPIDALIEVGTIDGKMRRGIVVERLSRPDAADLLAATSGAGVDLGRLRDKRQAMADRLEDLATALGDGVLPFDAVRRASDRLQATMGELEQQIAALSAEDVLAPLMDAVDIGATWAGYDLAKRRAVVDVLMTVTLLAPKRGRFDAATVRIEWRSDHS